MFLGIGWGGGARPRATPRCLDGQRACPPEDCGGPPGYENLIEILRNPKHDEYQETAEWLREWYGKYDPERFDPAKVKFTNPQRFAGPSPLDPRALAKGSISVSHLAQSYIPITPISASLFYAPFVAWPAPDTGGYLFYSVTRQALL